MKIILLGAPGSGKGTVADQICAEFNIPHISTGVIFRDNIEKGTEIGKLAKQLIDNGSLMPDNITIALVKDRLLQTDCKNGYVLDGFPRTLEQAKALSKLTQIDAVIYINVPKQDILNRIENRMICTKCKKNFDKIIYKKSVCDQCGGKLEKRADDNLVAIEQRYDIYTKESQPLIKYYQKQMFEVAGSKTREETYKLVREFLKKRKC
ncbi:MAG: adenylate kinase [Clostridia bacterium]|nr:adenylate kinase [Clostridia bacterium]